MARAARRRWSNLRVQAPKPAPVSVRQPPTEDTEPMTSSQAAYLRRLCRERRVKFNPSLGKKAATTRIRQLTRRI